jgi:hypothetical protein
MAYSNTQKQLVYNLATEHLIKLFDKEGIPYGTFQRSTSYEGIGMKNKDKVVNAETAVYVKNGVYAWVVSYSVELGKYTVFNSFQTRGVYDWRKPLFPPTFNPFIETYTDEKCMLGSKFVNWGDPFYCKGHKVISGFSKPSYKDGGVGDLDEFLECVKEFIALTPEEVEVFKVKKMNNVIEVNLQDGKTRVLDFINELYNDTISDCIGQLNDCNPIQHSGLANDISKTISHLLEDHKNITNDLEAIDWPSLHSIVSLIAKYPMLEQLEDTVIGRFLDVDIIINVSK